MKLTRKTLQKIEVEAKSEAHRVDCHGHASTWDSRQYLALADAARVIDKMLAEKELSLRKYGGRNTKSGT